MSEGSGRWPHGGACWIEVELDDLEAGRRFYTDLLGWEFEESPPEAGGYLMAMRHGAPVAGIGPKQGGGPGDADRPSAWTTYLAADSADETQAAIAAAGGRVCVDAFDVMDLGRMLIASDPAGAIFGVWEAKAHTGVGVVGRPGTMCWNELHTLDYAAAQTFYAAVFGYTYGEIGDGEHFVYSQVYLPESGPDDLVGGFCDDTKSPYVPPVSFWQVYIAVDDTDAATAKVTELGGQVYFGPSDSPFGRMAVVGGPEGEMFAIIDPETTSGEAPEVRD